MEYTELFEQFFNLNPIGKKEGAFGAFTFAQSEDKVSEQELYNKYKEYLDMCKAQKRQAQYIKTPEKFLDDKFYIQQFQSQSGSTMSFIGRWLDGFLSLIL